DADDIIDALSDDLLAEGDLGEALRRLMERGIASDDPTRPRLRGLNDLLERLERRREELLARNSLGDVLEDIREEVDAIVDEERRGIERRLERANRDMSMNPDPATNPDPAMARDPALDRMLEEMSRKRLDQLDRLPPGVGDRIRGLEEYDFLEPGARERFDALVDRLRSQVLDQYVNGLSEAIRSVTPADLAANREMVRDLNRLLEDRLEGRDPDASEFLAKHGRFFPGAENLDDIVQQLAERMGAMQSLLQSMTPEQRAELQSMMDALLRDDRLRWDLAQLAANMDQLLPGGLGDRYRFSGDEPMGLEPALRQMAQLQALDRLSDEVSDVGSPADLTTIDRSALADLLGDDAVRELDAVDHLVERLEEAGYVRRSGDRLELTPRGSRRVGQKVLDDLFSRLRRDAFGGHRIDRAGRGGEREEATKPYEFGDRFDLDLRRTLGNALLREANAPGRHPGRGIGGRGVTLVPGDFEVYRTEESSRTSTVLLVDMSRSMLLRGCYVAAKKVAIALATLIRSQFPRDDLAIIGFAYYAREVRAEALAELSWHGYEYGTNLQHGLILARRILARRQATNKEIVVITDGEPTAHFENGQVEFSYPPTRRTISETLREVERCTREGITINTFMLERSRALTDFVAHITKLNRGRAFYATPEHLGEYVLVDFVSRRTKRVS
ncbi:MAG TPA: VWA domain-containing protein, partial [Candidatus Limnocylindrales bacterium]